MARPAEMEHPDQMARPAQMVLLGCKAHQGVTEDQAQGPDVCAGNLWIHPEGIREVVAKNEQVNILMNKVHDRLPHRVAAQKRFV